jgi:hypothetical protein
VKRSGYFNREEGREMRKREEREGDGGGGGTLHNLQQFP